MFDESILKDIKIRLCNRFYFLYINSYMVLHKEIEKHNANMQMVPANDTFEIMLSCETRRASGEN